MRTPVLALVLAGALGSPILGQGGPWHGSGQFYVSPVGSDSTGNGTLAAPFRSISFAVSTFVAAADQGFPVTINVLPGDYGPGFSSEVYPITLPARNMAIEAYLLGAPNTLPLIHGESLKDVFVVDRPGAAGPDSVIRGFEIVEAERAVRLNVGLSGAPSIGTDRVLVRQCEFTQNNVGVMIETGVGFRSEHVLEDLEIHGNAVHAILVRNEGVSSNVIRSNLLFDHEVNLAVENSAQDPDSCQPRIQSNILHTAEHSCDFVECSPWVINNTIAFSVPFSTGATEVAGIYHSGGTLHLTNNIVWIPDASSLPGLELVLVSGTMVCAHNDFEVIPPGCTGSGNVSVDPLFVDPTPGTMDLHLKTTSPVIAAGLNAAVLPPQTILVGGTAVVSDLRQDFDLGARCIDFVKPGPAVVDIGADEVAEVALSVVSGADSLGNVQVPAGPPVLVTIAMAGRPQDLALFYASADASSDPLFLNTFLTHLGNGFLDPLHLKFIASTVVPSSGVAQFTFPLASLAPELEFYVQGVLVTGTGLGDFTNQIWFDVNE